MFEKSIPLVDHCLRRTLSSVNSFHFFHYHFWTFSLLGEELDDGSYFNLLHCCSLLPVLVVVGAIVQWLMNVKGLNLAYILVISC